MKNSFYKKLISICLILSISLSYFAIPQHKVKAQYAVFDSGNFVENTLDTISNVASEVMDNLMELKEFVLDPLANGLAKMVARTLTTSVVNWINSGFKGSPAFVKNPGSFFLNIADQVTGSFLANGGPLSNLCSPFSLDLKKALSFKFHLNLSIGAGGTSGGAGGTSGGAGGTSGGAYSCTLSKIISNTKSATMNGFTSGDFKQGGWQAFVSLTTEPQNNIYGAYLKADEDLTLKVASAQSKAQAELNQGKGFLSWRTCSKPSSATSQGNVTSPDSMGSQTASEQASAYGEEYNPTDPAYNDSMGSQSASDQASAYGQEYNPTADTNTSEEDYYDDSDSSGTTCEVQTPGSIIGNALTKQLGSGTDALNAADEIGEIVNALFAQLASQVLQGGLSGVSQKNSSGQSYMDQTINSPDDAKNVESMKTSLLSNMSTYISRSTEYKKNRDDALQFINGIRDTYDSAKACYSKKIDSSTLTSSEAGIANSRIQSIDAILSSGNLASTTISLINLVQDAQYRLNTLELIEASTTVAKTLSDLTGPSMAYQNLSSNGDLTNELDVQNSKDDLTKVQTDNANAKQDSVSKLNECQGFPANLYYGGRIF